MKFAKKLLAISATLITLVTLSPGINAQDSSKSKPSDRPAAVVVPIDSSADAAGQSLTDSGRSQLTNAIQAPTADIPATPGGTRTITFAVRSSETGAAIPNSSITILLQPGTFNGGHLHSGSPRPLGTFPTMSFNTGSSGVVPLIYTSPAIAGEVILNGSCTSGDGNPCTWVPATIVVKLAGLQELGASTIYELTGAVAGKHVSNHWGTPGTIEGLANLAFSYYSAPQTTNLTGSAGKLRINDMSLQWGGLYDCFPCKNLSGVSGVEWQTPHQKHREGTNADISKGNIPSRLYALVEQQIRAAGFTFGNEKSHWHVLYVGKPKPPPSPTHEDSLTEPDNVTQAASGLAVQPSVQVTSNSATGIFTYQYAFRNETNSTLEVNDITISLNGAQAFNATTPQGWTALIWRDGSAVNFGATDAGDPSGGPIGDGISVPSPFQIKPGQTLAGFSFQSVSPPGASTFTANGFKQPAPSLGDDAEEESATPVVDFSGQCPGSVLCEDGL
ncbi:MAG TPA: hypothetical protein VNO50_06685 [Pyrinomonadaceae bacterium]|nr:hypothetical protein [Pyrinomonadaceae bacterium]